mmetsp:Transcript_46656/g.114428  ORF Transcript_46656/g.114428 Transcript_46656/m.114428 type:complete len:423 (+) Transcript_46656:53-1321(+)
MASILAAVAVSTVLWVVSGDPQATVEGIVPGRLLNRMQSNLVNTATFVQATDFEEVEGLESKPVFERYFLGGVSSNCKVELGQGQNLRVSSGHLTASVLSEVTGNISVGSQDMESAFLLLIGHGAMDFFASSVGEATELELFWLNNTSAFQVFKLKVLGDLNPENAPVHDMDPSRFVESMTVSDIADACPNGQRVLNTVVAPVEGQVLPDDLPNIHSVNRTGESDWVEKLPYTDLPRPSTVIDIYYSPNDAVVEIASLMIVFADLWFLHEIQPPRPFSIPIFLTTLLVWMTALVVGSINCIGIRRKLSSVLRTWVSCGTGKMVPVFIESTPHYDKLGFVGTYICHTISLERTVEWYTNLLYFVPGTVMCIVTVATLRTYSKVYVWSKKQMHFTGGELWDKSVVRTTKLRRFTQHRRPFKRRA